MALDLVAERRFARRPVALDALGDLAEEIEERVLCGRRPLARLPAAA